MTVAGCPQPQGLPMTLSLPSSRHPSPSIRARVHSAHQAQSRPCSPTSLRRLFTPPSLLEHVPLLITGAPDASPPHTVALILPCAPFWAWSSSSLHSGRLLEHPWKVCPARVVLDDAEICRKRKKKRCILLEGILAFSGELRSAKKRERKEKVHSSRRNPRHLRGVELQAPVRMMRGEKGEGKDTGCSRPDSFIPLPPSLPPRGYGNHRTGTSPGGTRNGSWEARLVSDGGCALPPPPQTPHPRHHHMSTPPSLPPFCNGTLAMSFCLYYLTLAVQCLPSICVPSSLQSASTHQTCRIASNSRVRSSHRPEANRLPSREGRGFV